MVVEQSTAPDERVLRAHVASAQFINGVERGKWRIVGAINWPSALVAVSAASREGAPEEFFFRFDLAGYPNAAPTATPWDLATGDVLDEAERPKGDGLGLVFRTDWEGGRALYAPFDSRRTQLPRWLAVALPAANLGRDQDSRMGPADPVRDAQRC